MVGESNYDRAYLMALCAWKLFGHTSEPHQIFAQRIGGIGGAQGINAAAEAIAEDCRGHGLQMSAGRVLKSLAGALERHRDQLRTLDSIEEFQVEEIGRPPPDGLSDLLAREAAPKKIAIPWGCLLFIIVLVIVGWLIFR